MHTHTISTPTSTSFLAHLNARGQTARPFIRMDLVLQCVALFAYVTLPLWGAWLANRLVNYTVAVDDLLFAMAWLPIASAIVGICFMRERPIRWGRGWVTFALLNTLALSLITYAFR